MTIFLRRAPPPSGRLAEWGLSVVLLLFGVILALPTPTFDRASYAVMARAVSPVASRLHADPEILWAVGCIVLGIARLLILYVNGAWRRSPHLRAIGAFLSVFAWAQISLSFLASQTFSTGLAVYPVFVAMDLISTYRAALEARQSDDIAGAVDAGT